MARRRGGKLGRHRVLGPRRAAWRGPGARARLPGWCPAAASAISPRGAGLQALPLAGRGSPAPRRAEAVRNGWLFD
jgi:hypothetical protein